jgi:DNA-binding CsgD family transcriptional regulator
MDAALDATPDVLFYIRRSGEIRGLNRAGQDLLRQLFPSRQCAVTIAEAPLAFAPLLFELIESLRQTTASLSSVPEQGSLTLESRTHRYYARCYAEGGRALGIVLRLVPEVPRTPIPAEEHRGWPLTRREREIVTLMAYGRQTTDICALLGISRETFKTHLRHVYKKTGAQNRVDLIVRVGRGRTT